MNTLIIISLLRIVVCRALGDQGSEDTYSGELARVTAGLASGEAHLHLLNDDDDELGVDEELSGGENEIHHVKELHAEKDERRKRKGKGKRRNRQKSKSTTPFNPEHINITRGHTSTLISTQDPCTSTHLGYCIHGNCKYIEGLREPVCICMKGYDGERCGIQILGSFIPDQSYSTELVQTVLVVIAVVLSVISCCAILLMTCAHYRSRKNFLASYLGSGSEQEKLQKPMGDVVV